MTQPEQQQREPVKYRVVFSGCNHQAIMSDKELHNPVETQFNPATLHKENVFVCPYVLQRPQRGDFRMDSILHTVQTATRVREPYQH
ncbi:MAG TPA: hypothetical protein VFR94_06190 [Nitrososphaeraceae archaeon]|nr:hypothetical protein [Nitrososphaeraceae archaeon]